MRRWTIVFVLAAAACGNSGGGGGGDMGALGGNDLAGAAMVALSGHLNSSGGMGGGNGIAGAMVQIMGATPAITTTTAADGSWSLMVPEGATVFVGGSASNYHSGEVGLVVPTGGTSGVDFNLVSDMDFNMVANGLSPALTVDTSKGVVAVNFHNTNKAPGYGASISANHAMAFSINDQAGTATYSTSTVQNSSVVIFPNTDVGTTTVTVTPPTGKTCTSREMITNWRVDANYFTFAHFDCM